MSFNVTYQAWNTATPGHATGDAANHTISVVVDGTALASPPTPTELGNGRYVLSVPDADLPEGSRYIVHGSSSTADVFLFGSEGVRPQTMRGTDNANQQTPLTAAEAKTQADAALTDYDPPTRGEATADKDAILTRGDAAWITASGFAEAGDAMTLTPAERDAAATVVESHLLDEGDGQQLIDAILQVINNNLDLPALELTAIAQRVRTELATELARIDQPVSDPATVGSIQAGAINAAAVAASALDGKGDWSTHGPPDVSNLDAPVSTRMAAGDYAAPDNAGIGAIRSKTDNLPANPAAAGDAMTLSGGERDAVADSVLDRPINEPGGVFTWVGGASLRGIVGWLGLLGRNKITQSQSTQAVRNDEDTADAATASTSDDGETFTRGEWS